MQLSPFHAVLSKLALLYFMANVKWTSSKECDKQAIPGKLSAFRHLDNGRWITMLCAPGTLFSERDCTCNLHISSLKACNRKATSDPRRYIQFMGHGVFRTTWCTPGLAFSSATCSCSRYSRPIEQAADFVCEPLFEFIFNRTAHSIRGGIAAVPHQVQYEKVSGASYTAHFNGQCYFTIYMMSGIYLGSNWALDITFKLESDYNYENRDYDLLLNGPCGNSKYSWTFKISVNPVEQKISASLRMKTGKVIQLKLEGAELEDEWVKIRLCGKHSKIQLISGSLSDWVMLSGATLKSNACPMTVGGGPIQSPKGFVGDINSVYFYNCYNR